MNWMNYSKLKENKIRGFSLILVEFEGTVMYDVRFHIKQGSNMSNRL